MDITVKLSIHWSGEMDSSVKKDLTHRHKDPSPDAPPT